MRSGFAFSLPLRALDQPLTGKTRVGARVFCGFQATFFQRQVLESSWLWLRGHSVRTLGVWGCVIMGSGDRDSRVPGRGCSHLACGHFSLTAGYSEAQITVLLNLIYLTKLLGREAGVK